MGRYFFIVGAQKSGSTWLQRLINSHPLFSCKGEGHFFDRLASPIVGIAKDYNNLMSIVEQTVYEGDGYYNPLPSSVLRNGLREWISDRMRADIDPGTVIAYGDKTPASGLHIPLIKNIFPDAKIIHLARDGRDVSVSAYYHMRRVTKINGNPESVGSFEQLAAPLLFKWYQYTKPCFDYNQKTPLQDCLEVRYEDLKTDPKLTLDNVFSFLLDGEGNVSEKSIDHCIEQNSFSRRTGGRKEGEASESSFLRKGIVGDWRNHFTDQLLAQAKPECFALLQQLGYQ